MEYGIVGLPGCGKTTLFNALTGMNVDLFAGGLKPNIGVAHIPDPRLNVISEFIPPQKIIPATLQLVDLPGIAPGAGTEKLNAFLSHVRQVDAICHVVRCFDDGSGVDPAGDIEKLETELILADLVVTEGAIDKAKRPASAGDKDAKARLALLEKAAEPLNDGEPIRSRSDWGDFERATLKSYGMITAKPMMYVANIAEDDLGEQCAAADKVRACVDSMGSQSIDVCAKLEAELAELDEDDRREMLESLGLIEPVIGPLARALHETLGLTTFYTAGPKEVRAWTIPAAASAPEAAGVIHSDIQRGFIRAECYNVNDLVELKSEKAIREAGKLRVEGKQYHMRDGDVVHFLFNV